MRSRQLRDEQGASLVIVLIIMSVLGLILSGLLTEAGASVKYTSTVTNYEKKVYAADAGVAAGIQQLRLSNSSCATTNSTATLQAVTVNGYDAGVGCNVVAGSTIGGFDYAIITRSSGPNSLVTQSGSAGKLANGQVYVGGSFDGNPGMTLTNGNFKHGASSGCTSGATTLTGLTLDSGYSYICGAAEPTVTAPTAPTLPSSPRASQTPTSGAGLGCTYFYPGKYISPPSLGSGTNYFASGVYYFENMGQWQLDRVVFAGTPASYEQVAFKSPVPSGDSYTPKPTCANDGTAIAQAGGNAPEVTGTGAQFILGGNSRIFLANTSQLEVFGRTLDGTSSTAAASVLSVPSSWVSAGWMDADDRLACTGNGNNSPCAYDFTNGSGPNSVIHGQMYLPDQNVRLWSTNSVRAAVLGGIVVWELELQSSSSGNGLQVTGADGLPEPRQIVITSTAPATPSSSAGRQITSTAVVEIANDVERTVTILSWRTKGLTESL